MAGMPPALSITVEKECMVLEIIGYTVLICGITGINPSNHETGPVKTIGQMNQKIMEIRFNKETSYESFSEKLDSFSSFVRIPGIIPASKSCLDFDLVIRYTGNEPVEIYNPLYYLQFTVIGRGGQLNTAYKPPIPLINTKTEILPDDFIFDISKLEENGKELNIQEEVNKPSLVFENGGERVYRLNIRGYEDSGRFRPLDAGSYQISFLFSIIAVGKENDTIQHLTFKTNQVTVQIE